MNKRSDDYIPYACEIEAARAEAAQRVADRPDPRKTYIVNYTVNSIPYTEEVFALDARSAEEHLKQQCGMVGMVPANITIVEKVAAK